MSEQHNDPDYQLKSADQLDEIDLLKIRLLNRNIDCLELELRNVQLRLQAAAQTLQDFSIITWERYGIVPEELDGTTGKITRNSAQLRGQRQR